jgi:hypothetical protein
MTPKEKAIELYEFYSFYRINEKPQLYLKDEPSKYFASRCIDEVINACEINMVESHNTDWWNKVKQELELL